MLLNQVKNLLSEKSGLESELRAFNHIIQRLMTNLIHATPAQNTSQLPRGPFGFHGSSEPTPGLFGICGSAEPTPGPSGGCGFSVKSSNHPTYESKQTLADVTAFLFALKQHLWSAAQAIGWVSTTGWGEQAVLQLTGDAVVWAMHCFPLSTPIEWSTICTELKAVYIPYNALDLV